MTKAKSQPQSKPRRKTSNQPQRKQKGLPHRSATKTQQQLATTADEPLATKVTPNSTSDPSTRQQQPQASTLDNKPQTNHPVLEADDLDRMRRLMATFGIVGSSTEVFAALLDRCEQLQQQPTLTPNPDLETIRWFTREIDSFRDRVTTLQQEKDQLKVSAAQLDEIADLQAENALLKRQLQQNQAVLDSLRDSLRAGRAPIGAGEASTSPNSAATMPSSDAQETTPNLSHTSATPASTNGSGATTDEEIASASPPSTPPKPAKKTRSGAEQTAAKIHQILDALIAWNADRTHSHQRIRIGILPVKALASKMGSEEIEQMHQRLMLGSKHNRSLFNKDELLQAIARDLLHLPNWQDVRY